MKFKIIAVFVLLISILFTNNVEAQGISSYNSLKISEFNLENISFQEGQKIKGNFVIHNKDEVIQNDLYYEVSLVSDYRPDGIPLNIYDVKRYGPIKIDSLNEKIDFEYSLPNGIHGEKYGINLGLTTKTNQRIYWTDKIINIEKSENPQYFARLDVQNVVLEKEGVLYPANAGPNISGDEKVFLQIMTNNYEYNSQISGLLKISEFGNLENPITEDKLNNLELIDGILSVEIPNVSGDGVFVGEITLFDDNLNQIYAPMIFRFIKGGNIATIHNLIANKSYGYKKDVINIKTEITGNPINIDTLDNLNENQIVDVEIKLLNEKGVLVGREVGEFNISNNTNIESNIKLDKNARFLTAEVNVIKDSEILDTYKTDLSNEVYPFFDFYKNKIIQIVVSVILLLVIIFAAIFFRKNKKGKNMTISIFALLALFSFMYLDNVAIGQDGGASNLGIYVSQSANANWENAEHSFSGFIMESGKIGISDGVLPPNTEFYIIGNSHYDACSNTIHGNGNMKIDFNNNGNEYTANYRPDAAGTQSGHSALWASYLYSSIESSGGEPFVSPDESGDYQVDINYNIHLGSGIRVYGNGYVPYQVDASQEEYINEPTCGYNSSDVHLDEPSLYLCNDSDPTEVIEEDGLYKWSCISQADYHENIDCSVIKKDNVDEINTSDPQCGYVHGKYVEEKPTASNDLCDIGSVARVNKANESVWRWGCVTNKYTYTNRWGGYWMVENKVENCYAGCRENYYIEDGICKPDTWEKLEISLGLDGLGIKPNIVGEGETCGATWQFNEDVTEDELISCYIKRNDGEIVSPKLTGDGNIEKNDSDYNILPGYSYKISCSYPEQDSKELDLGRCNLNPDFSEF